MAHRVGVERIEALRREGLVFLAKEGPVEIVETPPEPDGDRSGDDEKPTGRGLAFNRLVAVETRHRRWSSDVSFSCSLAGIGRGSRP